MQLEIPVLSDGVELHEQPIGGPASVRQLMDRIPGRQIKNMPVDIESLRNALRAVRELRDAIVEDPSTHAGLVPESITVSFAVSTSGGVAIFGTQASRETVATFELSLRFDDQIAKGKSDGELCP